MDRLTWNTPINYDADPWGRVNSVYELVKQEGDVETERAIGFLIAEAVSWRESAAAWRRVSEALSATGLVQSARAERARIEAQLAAIRNPVYCWGA